MSCFWEFFSFFPSIHKFTNSIIYMKKFFKIFVSLLQATFDFDNYVYEIRFSAYREIFVAYVRFIFEIYPT